MWYLNIKHVIVIIVDQIFAAIFGWKAKHDELMITVFIYFHQQEGSERSEQKKKLREKKALSWMFHARISRSSSRFRRHEH